MSRRQQPAAGPGPGGPTAQRFLQHNFPFVSGLQNATFENCTWSVTEADGTVRSGRVTRDGRWVSDGGEGEEVPKPQAAATAAAETSESSSKTRESDEHIDLTQDNADTPAATSRTQARGHPSPSPFPSTVRNTIKFYSYDDFLLHGVYKPVPPPGRTEFSAQPPRPAGRFESSTPGTAPRFDDRRNRPTGVADGPARERAELRFFTHPAPAGQPTAAQPTVGPGGIAAGPTRKRGFAKRRLESAHIEELPSDEDHDE